MQASNHISEWDTGVAVDTLKFVGAKSVEKPHDWVGFVVFYNSHKTGLFAGINQVIMGNAVKVISVITSKSQYFKFWSWMFGYGFRVSYIMQPIRCN